MKRYLEACQSTSNDPRCTSETYRVGVGGGQKTSIRWDGRNRPALGGGALQSEHLRLFSSGSACCLRPTTAGTRVRVMAERWELRSASEGLRQLRRDGALGVAGPVVAHSARECGLVRRALGNSYTYRCEVAESLVASRPRQCAKQDDLIWMSAPPPPQIAIWNLDNPGPS